MTMAQPALRLLPLFKAQHLRFQPPHFCIASGILFPVSAPSPAPRALNSGVSRQCDSHPHSSAQIPLRFSSSAAGHSGVFCIDYNWETKSPPPAPFLSVDAQQYKKRAPLNTTPPTSAGFSAPPFGGGSRSNTSSKGSRRPSLAPSFRHSVSRAMASEAPSFAPVAKPVDATNGVERILAFWFGDWAVTADKVLLGCRELFFLLRMHHQSGHLQIVGDKRSVLM